MASTQTWNSLPTEMKMAVVNLLEAEDIESLSKVNMEAYYLSVPVIFQVCSAALASLQGCSQILDRSIAQLGSVAALFGPRT